MADELMKRLVIAALIATTILPVKAQFFSREAFGGAALGGLAGGIIGHNSGGRTAEGIGIGAGVGLLLGAMTSQYKRDYYGYQGYETSVPYSPQYYRTRPNYAVGGAVLGGIAGGVIGHNNGRHTAEGIAIGAGAGLLLGGLAEYEMRKRASLTPYYMEPARSYVVTGQPATVLTTTPVVTQAVQPAQQITIINNYPATSSSSSSAMSGANALFGR